MYSFLCFLMEASRNSEASHTTSMGWSEKIDRGRTEKKSANLRSCTSRKNGTSSHKGFTLVELLVVIVIIGILIGILMPAVQAARESGRRTSCLNNLHQMGIALQAYHEVEGSFPTGCVETRAGQFGDAAKEKRQLAWSAYILPFLEQKNLADKIDFTKPFDHEDNAVAAAVVLPVYLCPSAGEPGRQHDGRGATDYGGIYGERIMGPNNPPKGTMLYNRVVRISQIRDGASNTLIVGEDSNWQDGQWINGANIFDQAYAINEIPSNGFIENEIRSNHPEGADALFCDGRCTFLSEQLDTTVLAAICTREGGEVVPAID